MEELLRLEQTHARLVFYVQDLLRTWYHKGTLV